MFEDLIRNSGQGPADRNAWNELVSRLEGGKITPGPRMFHRRGPNGQSIWAKSPPRQIRSPRRFQVWLNETGQKLHVDVGSIRFVSRNAKTVKATFPTLNGTSLNNKDDSGLGPAFDIAGKTVDQTYTVALRYHAGAACGETTFPPEGGAPPPVPRVLLLSAAELAAVDLVSGERIDILSEVQFSAAGSARTLKSHTAYIESDITHQCFGSDNDSDDSDDSDDDSDDSDDSGNDSDDSDNSDDDPGSGDSDDSDDGGGGGPGACCQSDFTIETPGVMGIGSPTGGSCYPSGGPALSYTYISVTGNVAFGLLQDECPDLCRGRLFVRFTVTGAVNDIPEYKATQYTLLGFGGVGGFTAIFKCLLGPCTPIIARAWIERTLAVGTETCEIGDCSVTSEPGRTPHRCGDPMGSCDTTLPPAP